MKPKTKKIPNLVVWLLALFILLPVLSLFLWSVTQRWPWPELLPKDHSMRAFDHVFGQQKELQSLLTSSVLLSVVVGIFSVLIGLLTARALVFYDFWGKEWIYFGALLPFLIPATVFAMGIQVVFIQLGMGRSLTGVALSHLIYSLPYATKLLIDGVSARGSALEEQARVLGAAEFKSFYKVSLPNLAPVLLSAFSMSFIISFSQYFLTLVIGGGRIQTFAIVMVPYLQSGDRSIAAVYSLLFLGTSLLIFGFFELLIMGYYRQQIEDPKENR